MPLAESLRRCLILCLPGLLLAACAPDSARFTEFSGDTQGTTYHIKIADPPATIQPETIDRAIQEELDEVDRQMSTWSADSELSRFNRSQTTDWVPASMGLIEVIREAQAISEITQGAYDITVGPLLSLWGFGPQAREEQIPTPEAIAAAQAQIGYSHLHVRLAPPALRKDLPELTVELSSIAQGYTVDRVAQRLDDLGISNYLVEIGGELRGKGSNPEGQHWRIGIERPLPDERSIHTIIRIAEVGVSTSGDYRDYYERDGQRYSHTIDPRTGRPIAHRLASVTVVGDNAMHADAYATALMVLGPDEGFALAEHRGLAAYFILRSDQGFSDRQTAAFRQYRLEDKG